MSDFVSKDLLPELWEEILQRHWSYLETEESIQKLEEKKKLEGKIPKQIRLKIYFKLNFLKFLSDCLKEFLCVVPHDRKFFLPETAYVLKKTILEMEEFTPFKAMAGFEAISQYANNLFTKPWRREFRTLKVSNSASEFIKDNFISFRFISFRLTQVIMCMKSYQIY